MVTCFAPTCKHYSDKYTCKFFYFPKNPELLRKWIQMVRRQDREPNKNSRICSCHFVNGDRTTIPTLFNYNLENSSGFSKGGHKRLKEEMPQAEDPLGSSTTICEEDSTDGSADMARPSEEIDEVSPSVPMTKKILCMCSQCGAVYMSGTEHQCQQSGETIKVIMGEEEKESDVSDIDKLLIREISKRPPLFDHTLPIEERTKNQINGLWDEMFAIFGDYMTLDELKKRWKCIRYGYVRSRNIGSKLQKRHKYHHLLDFLNDTLGQRKKCGSPVEDAAFMNEELDEESYDEGPSTSRVSSTQDTRKKRKINIPHTESHPEEDEVDHFCKYFGSQLRKLDDKSRMEAQLECMRTVQNFLYNKNTS
ncbi:uncharacterized protein LOC115882748 [Sitophilus oryzae]|uniref:Uncharacterized protein LOC115882748 n=1 Tax=Sitophilus oryzae TaxID=7048 RepID=A0A6J2XZ95_SITOR|nr:uncharacterized protein LOC115882748 [Sitophilus oryzae]XP_030756833.1 uncharacterized protein LOC115882748 [Sitophilus oryzae]XP_030756834.1 uncharacterized protein LOC115882748 [Sitophilus oryzae]